MPVVVQVFAFGGKMGVSCSFGVIFLFFSELIPTVVRNMGLGAITTWSQIGTIICPYILYLGKCVLFVCLFSLGCPKSQEMLFMPSNTQTIHFYLFFHALHIAAFLLGLPFSSWQQITSQHHITITIPTAAAATATALNSCTTILKSKCQQAYKTLKWQFVTNTADNIMSIPDQNEPVLLE